MDKLDKEIQEALDNNSQHDNSGEDARAYLSLYAVLKESTSDDYLPSSFADKVVDKLQSSESDSSAFWWFGSAIMFMTIGGLVVTVMTLGIMNIDITNFFAKYLPMMTLCTIIIGVVQYLDSRLVKAHF